MRPLTTAVASGSLSSLVFALARELLTVNPVVVPEFSSSDICPLISGTNQTGVTIDFYGFLIGVVVGILAGPILDLVLLLRVSWNRALHSRGLTTRPLYRILG